MVQNGLNNGVGAISDRQKEIPLANENHEEIKPTYALEHLATFKVRNEAEIRNPKEKMKVLVQLDKSGGIWPQKMYMCFSGQWLVMLDSDMKEIENFPGSLITEPTAFISEDPMEVYNNILIFTVPGASLGNTEMHIFQVTDISAVHMVEDLKQLSCGNIVAIDRNKTPIRLPKSEKHSHSAKDQYGIAIAAAEVAAGKNAHDREQTERDIQVINHCFEDIERFVARLQYAAEALRELDSRQHQHNPHGEGLLVLRSRPPIESEFHDILAKHKLAFNYVVKLHNHFSNPAEPVHNMFVSLQTIVNVCNDVHVGLSIPRNVINPLLTRETITFLNTNINAKEIDFWNSLGINWNQPKDQFKNHKGSYHPIFYDDWSPDWVVDEDVPYLPPSIKKIHTLPNSDSNIIWLIRLQSRNVKIAEVLHSKSASNDKELNVTKGEYLEIIEDSRNWWKARNCTGLIGYVPHTILKAHNFEPHLNYLGRETDSLPSPVIDHENIAYHHTTSLYMPNTGREQPQVQSQQSTGKASIHRAYSVPNVPMPPPMPPASETPPPTPKGTIKRNVVAGDSVTTMRVRNDCETNDEPLSLQDTMNDELKYILQQRERRKDLEFLKTPEIYINQNSSPKEVEEWLRGKGFSDNIIKKLHSLNGEGIFALSPHVIEGYFGQKESRRLISQIVLQKNICEYKTIRSSELNAKLAKARQKADQKANDPNEIF